MGLMMRLVFILFVLSCQLLQGQDEKIYWKAGEKLTWNDFNAMPDDSHPFAAITFSGMSYGFSAEVVNKEVKVNYEVDCFFIPNKSWVKNEYNSDSELLLHEQLHFDITELYAREFRARLSKMIFTENVKQEIRGLYNIITKERVALQNKYDLETDHSTNKLAQKQWGLKIESELQKRIDFASK
jgi:hypothetical protein